MKAPMLTTALLLLAACSDNLTAPSEPGLELRPGGFPAGPVVVMTRNMYVGADLDAVIGALVSPDPEDDQAALVTAIQTLLANDLVTRANALADEIARYRPHVVGLQEVSTIDITIPPMDLDIHQDFLATLLGALQLRGLRYQVGASNLNFSLTGILGLPVALQDFDVLLVDSRVKVLEASNAVFSCPPLCLPLGFGTIQRGWTRVDAQVAGRPITFVSTHPESGDQSPVPLVRAGQMAELMGLLGAAGPVILMGDLNDVPGSDTYQVLQGAGFTDLWNVLGAGDGNTCCHNATLDAGSMVKRIDYLMTRGDLQLDHATARIERFGLAASERVTTPQGRSIWPSDHAGLVAAIPLRP
jgi:endonuclease/exonuclease/phosphatase family metal-dependent hydrolase